MSTLNSEQILAIAEDICQRQGWPFLRPVDIRQTNECWTVKTNAGAIGCNAFLVFDLKGVLIKKSFAPR